MQKMSDSENANSIRGRMEAMRSEMDEEVQEIVNDVRSYFDWRSYVRKSPWICLTAAFAAGYLVVPKKKLAKSAQPEQTRLTADSTRAATTNGRAGGALLTLLGNMALRGISAYAEKQAGMFFETLAAKSHTAHHDEEAYGKSTAGQLDNGAEAEKRTSRAPTNQ